MEMKLMKGLQFGLTQMSDWGGNFNAGLLKSF